MGYRVLYGAQRAGLVIIAFILLSVHGSGLSERHAAYESLRSAAKTALPYSPVKAKSVDPTTRAGIARSYGNLPLSFEANKGQVDKAVKYLSKGNGYTLYLTSTEAVLSLRRNSTKEKKKILGTEPNTAKSETAANDVIRLKPVSANPNPEITGLDELPGRSNYFIGNDPAKWRTNVPNYAKVKIENVYPGIDLVYYGNQRQLEYDWIVNPSADPNSIKFTVNGKTNLKVNGWGDLLLDEKGELRLNKPFVYQKREGARIEIAGRYVLQSKYEVGFQLDKYDASLPLVIDPVLSYSTYLGGDIADVGNGIAVDSAGNAYVTGSTDSVNFPTENPFQANNGGSYSDAFITKLNTSGNALIYSTYLGGQHSDEGSGIAVDSAGNAYVAGWTQSANFPSANPFQTSGSSLTPGDAFVTKLNTSGNGLVYSTYLGGSLHDEGHGIAVDSVGNAYVTGYTQSNNFPTANPFQSSNHGAGTLSLGDAFVTKFSVSGNTLVYSTYLGGNGDDVGNGIAVDSSGNAYVTGYTESSDFPTVNPFQANNAGFSRDVFVTKLNTSGITAAYSTYLGGQYDDLGYGIAVDSSGNAYVTGYTTGLAGSRDFPTANPFQASNKSGTYLYSDAFVTKLNTSGNALIYSTYLGGNGDDMGNGIAVDSSGNAYVTGWTGSSNFPMANPIQTSNHGGRAPNSNDVFVTKLNAPGNALIYSTYLGGTDNDNGNAIAVSSSGEAYVTGFTYSSDFPLANPFQANMVAGASFNAFVTKIASSSAQSLLISTVAGNGTQGFSGDGGPATSASINRAAIVKVDAAGNLFIADSFNNRIRKVTPGGWISTVAGNGIQGFGGDGGPATSAQLDTPGGIAVDAAGNLFIADSYNHRIRKVTSAGVITTVAGNGVQGFGGDGGPATSAQLNRATGVTVDAAGNLFIADYFNCRIRKVTSAGVITTVAGNGTPGFSGDGGPATSAMLSAPWAISADAVGNLFIADASNNRIRKVAPTGVISTVAGTGTLGDSGDGGPATSAQLSMPAEVAVDGSGNLLIADRNNHRIRKVTPGSMISTVAGNGVPGFSGDGGPATSAQLNFPSGIAVDTAGNLFIADYVSLRIRKVSAGPWALINLTPSAGGSATSITTGLNVTAQAGYATVAMQSGPAPYATAVLSLKQNGVTVSETGVPASPPTTRARIFIDYRTAVDAVPAHTEAGKIDVNTGIAIVNYGLQQANVTYTLRDRNGTSLAIGTGRIEAKNHVACFIDRLKNDLASDFNLPVDFQSGIQFGSLDITADQPLSVLALRGTINQRDEFLMTTTPIADLTQTPGYGSTYFPQFADGGGYTTSLILLNTSSVRETGKLQIRDKDGNPLTVNRVGGTNDSTFDYSIEPGGLFRFQTDGFPANTKGGWVRLIPDTGTPTPVGSGVFGYNPNDVLVSESGIPTANVTTHARVYADLSGNHDTGLAIANVSNVGSNITISAYQEDGVTVAGSSKPPISLLANGYTAGFASGFVTGLPAGFTGVLDISSTVPFAALTLRSLNNERSDFLMTTFPVADSTQAAPSPIVFPQIADGGGYVTQFILLSPSGGSSTTLSFYGEDGLPLAIGK